jgi:hypothetical protein
MADDTSLSVVRWRVLRHCTTRMRNAAEMSGVGVWPGWPGDKFVTSEMVWCNEVDGTLDLPFSTGEDSRHPRSDEFSITWLTRVAGTLVADPETAMDATGDRLAVIHGAIESILADDPTLDDLDGLLEAKLTEASQVTPMTEEGPIGWGRLVMSCTARLD